MVRQKLSEKGWALWSHLAKMMEPNRGHEVLIDLHYFPCIEYFARILDFDKILIEINEHYVKQTYRNRCYIPITNKIQSLTVPVLKGLGKTKVKDVKIAYHQNWQDHHWRTIASAYGKAPFFDFFASEFHDILYRKYVFLVDLNLNLLTKCLDFLGMKNKQLLLTNEYLASPEKQIVDHRNTINPKKNTPDNRFFKPTSYNQVFGKDFVPNVSVIDLLFCEGSRANYIINRSISYKS